MKIKFLEKGLNTTSIIGLVTITLSFILITVYGTQYLVDKDIVVSSKELADKKVEYEITKLDAEISKIRSDTSGSLFWLKLIALFVTVGGAVGGYLLGQSRTTLARLDFENRKNVDEVYQSIVQELADESPILRAAAAVKLGSVLKSFPVEWTVIEARKRQMVELTKQVLAAALSIEDNPKVLKTLTISLALDKSDLGNNRAKLQAVDLSGARASDAYWADCDFTYADFYAADLSKVSFRRSLLQGTQYRESNLQQAVFNEAICQKTSFKLADLRGASFREATLEYVSFENAKVYNVAMEGATLVNVLDCEVDISENGDGSVVISVQEWLDKFRQ